MAALADAVQLAIRESKADWETERCLLSWTDAPPASTPWAFENWSLSEGSVCPRANLMDTLPEVVPKSQRPIWCASDGSGSAESATLGWAKLSSQSPLDQHQQVARSCLAGTRAVRLPTRVGSARCGVHEAELAGLLSLIKSCPLAPAHIVFDREALLHMFDSLPARSRRDEVKSVFLPWEARLPRLLQARDASIVSCPFPAVAN